MIWLAVVVWLLAGVCTLLWSQYTFEPKSAPFNVYRSYSNPELDAYLAPFVIVALGPLGLAWFAAHILAKSARTLGEQHRATRAELERELDAARKEVDRLLQTAERDDKRLAKSFRGKP